MTITVRMFARARELIGSDHVMLTLPDPAKVADLRRELGRVYPSLARLLQHSAFAVNDEYADDESLIPPGTEAVLLPPVSGG